MHKQYFRFGSQNSIDQDVLYVFDTLPSLQDCKKFCSSTEENKNIIVITDGIVTACYKGVPDEVNNALYYTYSLHQQDFPNPIKEAVKRNIPLKACRAIRIILSYLSRTSYRKEVKDALGSLNWHKRLELFSTIDFSDFERGFGNRNGRAEDINKSLAFQFVQSYCLVNGVELYTKDKAYELSIGLGKFFKREENPPFEHLSIYRDLLTGALRQWEVTAEGKYHIFHNYNTKIDLEIEREVYGEGNL